MSRGLTVGACSGTRRGGFVPICIYPDLKKSFKSISNLKFGRDRAKGKSHTLLIKLSVTNFTNGNAISQSNMEQVKAQLEALQREAEETRAKANSTRARFMRLTEAVDKLQLQALADIKAGNEYDAKEMLMQKRKVMQALENSKRRTELLDELLTKLGEAISGKEAQLIKILASDRLEKDIGKKIEGPVRVVSSTEDTSVAQDLQEHLSLDPDSKKTNMDEKAMRTNLTSHDEFQSQKNQGGDAKEFLLSQNKIRDDQFLAIFRGIDSYQDFLIDLDRSVDEMELKLLTLLKFSSLLLEDEEDRLTNQKVKTIAEILEALQDVKARIAGAMGNGKTSI